MRSGVRTPFIEIAHCISFVSSRGRGRASSSNAARGLITDATRICLRAFGVINGSPNYGPDRYRRSLPASKQRAGRRFLSSSTMSLLPPKLCECELGRAIFLFHRCKCGIGNEPCVTACYHNCSPARSPVLSARLSSACNESFSFVLIG